MPPPAEGQPYPHRSPSLAREMLPAQLAIAASPPLDLSGGLGPRFAACYLRGGCLRAHGLLARVSLGVGDGLDAHLAQPQLHDCPGLPG